MKRIRFPLSLKLIALTSLILGTVVVFVTVKNSRLFEKISIDKEESMGLQITDSKATSFNLLIDNYFERISYLTSNNFIKYSNNESLNFDDSEVQAIVFNQNETSLKISNLSTTNNEKYFNTIESKLLEYPSLKAQVQVGKVVLLNLTISKSELIFLMGFPLKLADNQSTGQVWSVIRTDKLMKILQSNDFRKFSIFDTEGFVLASSEERNLFRKNLKNEPVSIFSKELKLKNHQKYLEDINLKNWLMTASLTKYGYYVISQTPQELIFAPSIYMKENSYFILGIVLSFSVFIIFLFSEHISNPIIKLSTFAMEVGKGNLNVKATTYVKTNDELGDLALSFDEMTDGLKERDKMKNLFNKFHGTAVTEELLQNEISLGGKRKEVTVFFSDIRGFTDFSEGHTPEEVVSMLNEYFEVMVKIINDNGGVVDKFIGDAIMAVWGVPNTTDADTKNALNACLDMRMALKKLNDSRIERDLVPIKIGMGLHAGEAISGQIGSSERMEFTVIGDAVNTASRIEGSTKSFGTDLLISKECLAKIDESGFMLEFAGEAKVQGKSENLVLFKVNGLIIDDIPTILQTPYSAFEAVEDKKSKKAA